MSKIPGYNLFDNTTMIHKQIDVDEFFNDGQKSKKANNPASFADGQSAIYEPSQPKQPSATYEKPVSVAKKNPVAATNTVELSEAAKSLLEELKEKYGDTDFIIANYSSDEEAEELMSHGNKEFSVLIDPETLEKMAADKEVKEKYLGEIDSAKEKMTSMLKDLGKEGKKVESIGMTVKSDGTVSYFAKLREDSEARSKEIEKDIKERREEKKIKDKAAEKKKAQEKLQEKSTKTLSADSLEELLEKIKAENTTVTQ